MSARRHRAEAPSAEGEARELRLGAVGDIHFNGEDASILTDVVKAAEREADLLLLCGDLTTHGTPAQAEGVARALGSLAIPVVAVHLEVAMAGGEPAIEDFDDLDFAFAEKKAARRLLLPVAGVAFDPDAEGYFPLLSHVSATPSAARCR